MTADKLLLVHHFPLERVTGVTVMLAEILRLLPGATYLGFPGAPALMVAALEAADPGVVFAINLHIDVGWGESLALAQWCRARAIPLWNHVHDYWPHHRNGIAALATFGVRLAASTPFVCDALAEAGFAATVVPVGVPLPAAPPQPCPWAGGPRVFAAAGRLVPRKRFPDIAAAFAATRLAPDVGLYLRLLPSHVFGDGDDRDELARVERALAGRPAVIDRTPSRDPLDCSAFFAYIAASSYEGFGMTPIEAAYVGCPPLMSDIPAHRAIADTLFAGEAARYLFPMGDITALAALIADEATHQSRRALLAQHGDQVRTIIRERLSLQATADILAGLG